MRSLHTSVFECIRCLGRSIGYWPGLSAFILRATIFPSNGIEVDNGLYCYSCDMHDCQLGEQKLIAYIVEKGYRALSMPNQIEEPPPARAFRVTTSSFVHTLPSTHLLCHFFSEAPLLLLAQLDDVGTVEHPVLAGRLALRGQLSGFDSGTGDDVGLLTQAVAPGRADAA